MIGAEHLPHDPELPQLPRALDGAAMAAAFDALLAPNGRYRVERCSIERIKYRPRRNLAVAYRLSLRKSGSGASIEQRVAARFCAGGDSLRRYRKAEVGGRAASPAGLVCSHLPALDAVVFWWPHDPKLGLAAQVLADERRLRTEVLPAVVAALGDGRGRLVGHRLAWAQVVPEHRVSARLELQVEPGPGRAVQTHVVYAKADVEHRGAIMQAVLAAIAGSPAAAQGRLATPQPLLWQESLNLHWQAALPGRMLLDVEAEIGVGTAARVGTLLAALHATPAPTARHCSFAALRERIAEVATTLSLVNPPWAPALESVAERLVAGIEGLRDEPNATLHGDLHPRNLLLDGARLGLIDFDSACQGPAMIDLGDWIADALYRALLAGRGSASALPACRAFAAAYGRGAGRAVAESTLAWSVAHGLLGQRAWRCVVNLKPGRFALVPSLLALADALLRAGSLDAAGSQPWREAA